MYETYDNVSATLTKYPLVSADALIEICTAAISAVRSLDQHLSGITEFPAAIFLKISAAIQLMLLLCSRPHHFLQLTDAGQVACCKLFLCPEV
jgi:hypothetical protein